MQVITGNHTKERKENCTESGFLLLNKSLTYQASKVLPARSKWRISSYSVWNLVSESKKNRSSSNFHLTSTNNVWVSPLASQHHVLFIQLRSKKNESLVASHSVLLLWNYLWVDTLIFLFILWVNYFSSKGWRKE